MFVAIAGSLSYREANEHFLTEKQIDDELDSDDDDFMKAYRQKRLTELKEAEKQACHRYTYTLCIMYIV